jgi:hypothetical protein
MFQFHPEIINKIYSTLHEILYSCPRGLRMSMTKRKRTTEKKDGNILNFLIGLGLGAIGASIISAISKPNCPNPNCRQKIDRGTPTCRYCGIELEWK